MATSAVGVQSSALQLRAALPLRRVLQHKVVSFKVDVGHPFFPDAFGLSVIKIHWPYDLWGGVWRERSGDRIARALERDLGRALECV